MTKTQFLIFFLAILPFIGAGVSSLIGNHPRILGLFSLMISALFFFNCLELFKQRFVYDHDSLELIGITKDLLISFAIEPISLIFLLLISLIWMALNCYSAKYFSLTKDSRVFQFQIFTTLAIGFITLIIFGNNLLTVFLFYQALIFLTYFFNTSFLHKQDVKVSYNFTFFLLLSSVAFFLAMVFTYKIAGQIYFKPGGIIDNNLLAPSYAMMLFLYLFGLASVAFAPVYLLYGNLFYLNPPIMIVVFVLSYGLVSLLILLKVITYIFGVELFLSYGQELNYGYLITLILTLNLLISGLFSIFAKNLKRILVYLFFNQFTFVILSLFVFKQQLYQVSVVVISFILAQVLILFCVGNMNIYFLISKERAMNGIFYKLKITTFLLIFALLGIVGLAPSVGLIEKFLLLKQIIRSRSEVDSLILMINTVLNAICIAKIIKPMFEKSVEGDPVDQELVKTVETSVGLMLPIILIASIMFLSFLFPSYIINFSRRVF